ncbi:MAG TPA: hypothetical protein VGU90_05240 [Terriglobales bacterium]|nr:hypothetical protein [Terriglobales bacterium]
MIEPAFTASKLGLSQIVLAIGALGTASYGVVDVTKGFGGGVSNRGFGDIKKVIAKFLPAGPSAKGSTSALALPSVLSTLRANWLNGMALGDQKSIAKALIKLNLTRSNATVMAMAAGVDETVLASVAEKIAKGAPLTPAETTKPLLTPAETDVYGRFDLVLTAQLDEGYQRGDQRYRNSAKLLAVPIAVLLALLGTWSMAGTNLNSGDIWRAVLGGLLATPLAPVAKDLASAIQAGAKAAQSLKG